MNNINVIIRNINKKIAKNFIKNTSSSFDMKKHEESVVCDYEWIDIIDEKLPYLESVIQNPRRFLISEEEVLPVEKTKKVSRESIKHLSQHTSLIQKVDEDGTVHPEKLLNIYKEETYDIYENRFLFTTIKRLYEFLDNQMGVEVKSYKSAKKSIVYNAQTNLGKENIDILVKINSNYKEDLDNDINLPKINDKKLYIYELVENIYNGPFMQIMAQASPVRNPIRKTNAILKDQNFRKVLELWEFLDKIEDTDLIKTTINEEDINSNIIKDKYDFTYFLNYYFTSVDLTKLENIDARNEIEKLIENYLLEFNPDSNNFIKRINLIIRKIKQRKEKNLKDIRNMYINFIKNDNEKLKKAINLINKK